MSLLRPDVIKQHKPNQTIIIGFWYTNQLWEIASNKFSSV